MMDAPTTNVGVATANLLMAGASFILIFIFLFIYRLFLAPVHLYKAAKIKNEALKSEISELNNLLKPAVSITFDDNHPFIPCASTDGHTPPYLGSFVLVENIGSHYLEKCQVQIVYDVGGTQEILATSPRRFACAPFPLLISEHKSILIFRRYFENENTIFVDSVTNSSGEWGDSGITSLLLAGKTYRMRVEAISSNSRRASLDLVIKHDGQHWVIKNEPT